MKVILVGVGGGSCSGKTTLAKQLNRILPNSLIIHQDDFATPLDKLPIHPVHKVCDWDAAGTAIQWDHFVDFLQNVRRSGQIPLDYQSSSYLDEKDSIGLDPQLRLKWRHIFQSMDQHGNATEKVVWVIVDGFLLYWQKNVIDQLDVRIMLRVPQVTAKARRQQRRDWTTADGVLWQDPPGYWEDIVYPAYVDAHNGIFEDDDVEHGTPTSKIDGLVLLEGTQMSLNSAVERCCEELKKVGERAYGSKARL